MSNLHDVITFYLYNLTQTEPDLVPIWPMTYFYKFDSRHGSVVNSYNIVIIGRICESSANLDQIGFGLGQVVKICRWSSRIQYLYNLIAYLDVFSTFSSTCISFWRVGSGQIRESRSRVGFVFVLSDRK